MASQFTKEILDERLEGINDAQTRARISFFILVFASVSILIAIWNTYLAWDRQWSSKTEPANWGQQNVISSTIRSWVESQYVGIPLLGIRVATSDIALFGSVSLIIFSLYCCLCARRENHEIGTLLIDAAKFQDDDNDTKLETRWRIYYGIRAYMVMNPASNDDRVYSELQEPPRYTVRFFRVAVPILLYLPAFAIFSIIASDLFFAFFYKSPWRQNAGPAWFELEPEYRIQLAVTDFVGLIAGIIILYFCFRAHKYIRGTKSVMEAFYQKLSGVDKQDL